MRNWFRRRRPGASQPASGARFLRPCLEALEDRCLLAAGFALTALASDIPGAAAVSDPNLVNPWGISANPTGFFWFADNGAGVSDLVDSGGQTQPLVVSLPGRATGTVFFGGSGFDVSTHSSTGPSRFLFATQNGTIFGWNSSVDATHALLAVDNSATGASYTGLTLGTDLSGRTFLYAANIHRGTIDIFDTQFHPVSFANAFHDPKLPAGFVPFNVQNIDGRLFVTYTHGENATNDVASWVGNGIVDVFDNSGDFLNRFATRGTLNEPWGLALAPASFGSFGGDLLVGNNGDGRISAFDPNTGAFLGQLTDASGNLIAVDNLWGLSFGNGHLAGAENTLFFTAGIDHEQHGLFGAIRDPAAPAVLAADPSYIVDPADDEYPIPPNRQAGLAVMVASQTDANILLLAPPGTTVLIPTLSPMLSASTVASSLDNATQPTPATPRLTTSPDTGSVPRDNAIELNALLTVGSVPSAGVNLSNRAIPETPGTTDASDPAMTGTAGRPELEDQASPNEEVTPVEGDPANEPEVVPVWHRWVSLIGHVVLGTVLAAVGYHLVEWRPRPKAADLTSTDR
jgi:uncharacterized protein (TIGR03118 family)